MRASMRAGRSEASSAPARAQAEKNPRTADVEGNPIFMVMRVDVFGPVYPMATDLPKQMLNPRGESPSDIPSTAKSLFHPRAFAVTKRPS
jgi:hypothetical protein